MKLLRKKQKGFSLVEIMISVALAGILGSSMMVFTLQTVTQSEKANFHTDALKQLENVSFWVGHDVQMSQNVTLGPNGGFPLELIWADENNNTFEATFVISGTQLRRSVIENGGEPGYTILAESINPSLTMTNCSYTDGLLTLNVTATRGDWSLSRTFQIKNRPSTL